MQQEDWTLWSEFEAENRQISSGGTFALSAASEGTILKRRAERRHAGGRSLSLVRGIPARRSPVSSAEFHAMVNVIR